MQSKQLSLLYKTFDDIRHENGQEFWYARELYPILGYKKWQNFVSVIDKAKESCKTQNVPVDKHFTDVSKKVEIGSKAIIDLADVKLTRYASYLIALNGNPRIEEIAFAQAYFITQTRKIEVLQAKMEENERLDARTKLKETEKIFGRTLWERGVDGPGLSEIRNAGDSSLFGGLTTKQMKEKLGVKKGPLADVLPSVTIKAKDLATEMTTVNTNKKNLQGKYPIKVEHMKNNQGVRKALGDADIKPEELPAEENLVKIGKKHEQEKKLITKRDEQEIEVKNISLNE